MSGPGRTGWMVVTFLSDWHVGAGTGGAGNLDALLAREHVVVAGNPHTTQEVPFLPAKTLTGLLREAAELLASGLDGDGDTWTNLVERLFGGWSSDARDRAPSAALVSVRSGHLSPATVELFATEPSSLVGSRMMTAIDEETGAAADGSLRYIEIGSANTSFRSAVTLVDDPRIDANQAWAFLTVAAGLIDVVGAHGQRGFGRCRTRLEGTGQRSTLENAIDLIKSGGWAAPESPAVRATQGGPVAVTPPHHSRNHEDPITIAVDIECLSPLLVTPTTVGNVASGRDYVPGRVLLPVISQRLTAMGIDASQLVAEGAMRVEDAHPVDSTTGGASFPMPFAFSRLKDPVGCEDRVFNTIRMQPTSQAKQLRGGFLVGSSAEDLGRLTTAMTTRMHASIMGAARDGRGADGGLFSYEAIAAGAVFRTRIHLRAPQGTSIESVLAAVEGPAALGASRKDDYGHVMLRAHVEAELRTDATASAGSGAGARSGELLVVIVSPLVIVDPETGRFDPTVEGFCRELNRSISPQLPKEEEFSLVETPNPQDPPSHRIRVVRFDGFHGRWGLPQLTLVAIAPGSVVRLRRPEGGQDEEQMNTALARIETWGLGRRTTEGFGAVRFDPWQLNIDTLSDLGTRTTASARQLGWDDGNPDNEGFSFPEPSTVPVGSPLDGSLPSGRAELVFEARLVVDSPLLIGGEQSEDEGLLGEVLRPLRRVDGTTTFLPGTSIAGSLRAELRRRWAANPAEADSLVKLFGDLDEVGKSPLGTDDVVLINPKEQRWDRVAIDRTTGAAAAGAKFAQAAVEPGAEGTLRIRCSLGVEQVAELKPKSDGRSDSKSDLVLWLRRTLALLCDNQGFRLGRNASAGWGSVHLEAPKVAVFPLGDPQGVLDLARLRSGAPVVAGDPTPIIASDAASRTDDVASAKVHWQPRLPLTVGGEPTESPNKWPLVVRRFGNLQGDDGTKKETAVAVLPGSSIKGVLRSRAEWLVRTALSEIDHGPVEDLPIVPILFGSGPTEQRSARRGALLVSECTAPLNIDWETWEELLKQDGKSLSSASTVATKQISSESQPNPPRLVVRTHVAIDRWTGGSADARLFSVIEPWGLTWSPLDLRLDITRLTDGQEERRAAVALFLLLLEELYDGSISFGGGTTRGRGSITVKGITVEGLDGAALLGGLEEPTVDSVINRGGLSPLSRLSEAQARRRRLLDALDKVLNGTGEPQ